MNSSAENNLKRFYDRFNQDHASLRAQLLSDLNEPSESRNCSTPSKPRDLSLGPPVSLTSSPGSTHLTHSPTPANPRPLRYRRPLLALAAAILLSLVLWPAIPSNSQSFAADAQAALQQAKAKGVTWLEKTLFILPDGAQHESSTTSRVTIAADRCRRDFYDSGQLRETQWYTPADNGTTQTSVSFDTKTYLTLHHPGSFGQIDPLQRAQFLVNLIDKADHQLDAIDVNGRSCPGFEIRASHYGNNPTDWFDRIWFDPQTKLPVRIERHGAKTSSQPQLSLITVQEQFDANPSLPPDTFTPQIPPDFQKSPDQPK